MHDYEEEPRKRQENIFKKKQDVQLHRLIQGILTEAKSSKPLLPAGILRRTAQDVGLNSADDNFFNLMSSVIDYSLNDLMESIKDVKAAGKYRKETKDPILKTSDVQKVLEKNKVYLGAPRVQPQLGVQDRDEGPAASNSDSG